MARYHLWMMQTRFATQRLHRCFQTAEMHSLPNAMFADDRMIGHGFSEALTRFDLSRRNGGLARTVLTASVKSKKTIDNSRRHTTNT